MAGTADNTLGLYISIPFCRSKCTYCNFASGVFPAGEHQRYVDRVIHDMAGAASWTAHMGVKLPPRVDTVYLGGGTPTLLSPELLLRLFAAMRAEFDLMPDAEITVECAPGQLADEILAALVAAGVNRVSLGVQTFVDREAAVSGRLHNRTVVLQDLSRLRAAGVGNLSIDLIAGLAGQTVESWRESLATLIETGVPHASIYMLEVDGDSRLGRELLVHGARYGANSVPCDEVIAEMYSEAIGMLNRAGLNQYEISNFSRPGFASRHNLRYWMRRPYLGLGLDATSMLREASREGESQGPRRVLRSTTTSDLKAFLEQLVPGENVWPSPQQQHEEAWFLGLRLNEGVHLAALEREFGPQPVARALEAAARLADAGLVTSNGATVRLTPQGQLLSNDVFQEFLDLEAGVGLNISAQ